MYNVKIANLETLHRFLNSTDSEWVDTVVTKDGVLFIQDSSEVFAVYQLPSVRGNKDTDEAFRMEKSLLKLLALEGAIEMIINTDSVELTFVGNEYRRRVIVTKRQAFVSIYASKMNVLQGVAGQSFDATKLKEVYQLSKVLHSYVEVMGDTAGVVARDGTRIFTKVSGIPEVCLTASAMNSLYNCNSLWQAYQQYVIATDGLFGVVVTQCRGSGAIDYDVVAATQRGSAAIATINFTDVLNLMPKLPQCSMSIDLRTGECVLTKNSQEYFLTVDVQDLQIVPEFDGHVQLNPKVFSDLVAKLKRTTVTLSVKKNFYQIECGDLIILCK